MNVHLEARSDEHIHPIMPGKLPHGAVGMKTPVASREENIRTGGGVALHADLSAHGENSLDPAGFDGRDHGRQRVDHPITADFAFEPELLAIGRQEEFDGGSVEPHAVVQGLHSVFFVNAAQSHHAHEHLHIRDGRRIAGKEGRQVHGARCLHDEVHLVGGNVNARQRVHDFVDLGEDDAVEKGGWLHDGGSFFGVGGEKEIAVAVGLGGGDESHARSQIHIVAGIQLIVGVNGAEWEFSFRDQLRHGIPLGSRIAEIDLPDAAFLEESDVVRQGNAGHDKMQVAQHPGIQTSQHLGQIIRLLLVVAFQTEDVARLDDRREHLGGVFLRKKFPGSESGGALHTLLLVLPSKVARGLLQAWSS